MELDILFFKYFALLWDAPHVMCWQKCKLNHVVQTFFIFKSEKKILTEYQQYKCSLLRSLKSFSGESCIGMFDQFHVRIFGMWEEILGGLNQIKPRHVRGHHLKLCRKNKCISLSWSSGHFYILSLQLIFWGSIPFKHKPGSSWLSLSSEMGWIKVDLIVGCEDQNTEQLIAFNYLLPF